MEKRNVERGWKSGLKGEWKMGMENGDGKGD